MSAFKNILVVGASGRVGTAVQTELFAKSQNFSKLGVLRASTTPQDPKKDSYWESLKARGVEIISADFSDHEALVKAFKGEQRHISCDTP